MNNLDVAFTTSDPCLPGFETPPSTDPFTPQANDDTPQTPPTLPKPPCRQHHLFLYCAIALCIGLGIGLTIRLLWPRIVVKEIVREVLVQPSGYPLSLQPDTLDADVWPIVATMSGPVGGVNLTFQHGRARIGQFEYRVCPDFCRINDECYARLEGNGSWIVRVNSQGQILKAYPAPKNRQPLKLLLAK